MEEKKVSFELQLKLRNYLKYLYKENSTLDIEQREKVIDRFS